MVNMILPRYFGPGLLFLASRCLGSSVYNEMSAIKSQMPAYELYKLLFIYSSPFCFSTCFMNTDSIEVIIKNPEDKLKWTVFTTIKILDMFPGHKRSQRQISAA